MAAATPSPREIAAQLGRRVIGQRAAVREMAVGLAKHLAGLPTGNILMIGASGTGKTTLMRAVEDYLAADPELARRSTLVRLHANVLGEEAERGRPGEAVLGRLLARAREQLGSEAPLDALLERVRHGIVFIDEVDKIRSQVGDRPNVSGIRAQEALLTLIENEAVPFDLPEWARRAGAGVGSGSGSGSGSGAERGTGSGGESGAESGAGEAGDAERGGGGTIRVDSSGLLFVCAGAFEGLHDTVYDRVTIGRDRGSLRSVTVVDAGEVKEELQFSLRDWLRNEDLFDYGMSPQFLSRFDSVVLLESLGLDELMKIFLESPESSLLQSRAWFESRGIRLAVSPAAVRAVAEAARRQPRLGARALKEVFRRVIRDYEYDPERHAQEGGALVIDEQEISHALQ